MPRKVERVEDWKEVNKEKYMMSGYVQVYNDIIREIIYKSDMQTAMMYILILSHRNSQTNKCFPSIELLSRQSGLGIRQVKRMLDKLEEIAVLEINSGKQNVSNNYYFPYESFYEDWKGEDYDQDLSRRLKKAFKKKID